MALDPSTAARVDAGLKALRARQRAGQSPPPGRISVAEIAALCGVHKTTIYRIEATAIAKLRRILRDDPIVSDYIETNN